MDEPQPNILVKFLKGLFATYNGCITILITLCALWVVFNCSTFYTLIEINSFVSVNKALIEDIREVVTRLKRELKV